MFGKAFLLGAVLFSLAWAQPPEGAFPARILRWYDGDTAYIRFEGKDVPPFGVGENETIRLLGINAPEVGERWSEEATRLFRKLTMGKRVYVELNPWERRDVYSRLLAYIWVEREGEWVLVNEELLRAGLARLYVYYPEREPYYCRFLYAQTLAQLEGLGLWESAASARAPWEIEAEILRNVTQAVTVVFEVSRVGLEPVGWVLWASGSRRGLRAVLELGICRAFWAVEDFDPGAWVGKKVVVTGELAWDRLWDVLTLRVYFPDQLRVWEGE